MALRYQKKISVIVGFGALLLMSWSIAAWCGPMKLIMRDGTSVEVPYFWSTDGEYKLDIPGGIAGVPVSQVASVQEVLESREFDPDVLMQRATEPSTADQRKLVQDLVTKKSPGAQCEIGDTEQGVNRLKVAATKESSAEKPRIVNQTYTVEKSLPFICDEPGGPVLVIQEFVSSRVDLKGREFTLVLYDSEGKVLSRKACEVYPLTLDQDAQDKLKLRSRIFLVRASIKPDPKIRRYEIAAPKQ